METQGNRFYINEMESVDTNDGANFVINDGYKNAHSRMTLIL
jgi:hypothetical protein